MPRTRSLAFSELKIGILAVVALALVAFVILMLTGTGGFFWQRYWLKAEFIMLRDGYVCFEGTADELRHSEDAYLRTFLS